MGLDLHCTQRQGQHGSKLAFHQLHLAGPVPDIQLWPARLPASQPRPQTADDEALCRIQASRGVSRLHAGPMRKRAFEGGATCAPLRRLHKLEAKHAQRQQLAARASRASMEDIAWDDEEAAPAQPGMHLTPPSPFCALMARIQ